MNKDLFLAILSMDSYNRSYGQGLNGLFVPSFDTNGNATAVVKIGNAQISRDSSSITLNGNRQDIPAGFYAIAYELPAGYIDGLTGTVISYRGTNFDPGDSILNFFNSPLWQDIRTGWSVGAGWPAMLSANHPAVAANDNQMDAGLERAFRFGEARTAA